MTSTLARGEMTTVILPIQAVALGCAFLAFLGGLSLIDAAWAMRNSRDFEMQDRANGTFALAVVMFTIPLIMLVICLFIYQSQGGFE